MVVLGIVLLAGATVFAVSAVSGNTGAVETDLWGMSISNLSVGSVFVLGMITTAVGLAGLVLAAAGATRGAKRRRERRALTRENRRLTREMGRAAAAPAPATPVEPPAGSPDEEAASQSTPARERTGQSQPTA
jgi:steroid 5-alpha reductase family enzyme